MQDRIMAIIGIFIVVAMFFAAGIIDNPADYHYGADKRQVVVEHKPTPPIPPAEQPLFKGVVDGYIEYRPNRWVVVDEACAGLDEVHCETYFVDTDKVTFGMHVTVRPIGNYNEAELYKINY